MKAQSQHSTTRGLSTAIILAAASLVCSCSKSKTSDPPDPKNEYKVYLSQENTAVEVYSYCAAPNMFEERRSFDILLYLSSYDEFCGNFNSQYKNTKVLPQTFTLAPITGIDVIALKDYSEEYPEGSLLNPILDIVCHEEPEFRGSKGRIPYVRLDMTHYFAAGNVLEWKTGEMLCYLTARIIPGQDYMVYGRVKDIPGVIEGIQMWQFPVQVKLYLENGQTLEIYPMPTMIDGW